MFKLFNRKLSLWRKGTSLLQMFCRHPPAALFTTWILEQIANTGQLLSLVYIWPSRISTWLTNTIQESPVDHSLFQMMASPGLAECWRGTAQQMWLFPVSSAGSATQVLLLNPLDWIPSWPLTSIPAFLGPDGDVLISTGSCERREYIALYPLYKRLEGKGQKETPWYMGQIGTYRSYWHMRKGTC